MFRLLLLLSGLVFQAQAQEAPTFHYRDAYQVLLAEKFTFSSLQKKFDEGRPLDGHEFTGPKVGLAFYFNEPSTASSTAMSIEETKSGGSVDVYESSFGDGRPFLQDDATINANVFGRMGYVECYKTESDNPLLISIIPHFCKRGVNNHPDYAVEYRTSGSFVIAALHQKSDAQVEMRQVSQTSVRIQRGQIWGYAVYLSPLSY